MATILELIRIGVVSIDTIVIMNSKEILVPNANCCCQCDVRMNPICLGDDLVLACDSDENIIGRLCQECKINFEIKINQIKLK